MVGIEELMNEMQMQTQQLQSTMAQKQSLMVQSHEVEKALEYLENVNDEKIYKSIGPMIIETTKDISKKELEETKEDMELRVKTLDSQEEKLKEKLKETQEKLQQMAGQQDKQAS